MRRWLTYQKERFPLARHAPLVFAFSFSALIFSRLLRGDPGLPDPGQIFVAFFTALLFFLQLRIADEFKDHEEDSRYRPYRPVPRGLVSLRELAWVFAGAAAVQGLLALWLHPPLLIILAAAWLYLAAMSKEFFVRRWLEGKPLTYLWTHMLIMPLIDLYATSCDWLVAGWAHPPPGIIWFLAVSFFNGVLIEFGRKIRAPSEEEPGVRTYTVLWGINGATWAWVLALGANFALALVAATQTGMAILTLSLLGPAFLVGLAVAWGFCRAPSGGSARRVEVYSGLWTLYLYLVLGPAALLYSLFG